MTVWIYVDTSKEVGDADHLKVFANEDVANAWFRDNESGRRSLRISHHPIRPAASGVTETSRSRALTLSGSAEQIVTTATGLAIWL